MAPAQQPHICACYAACCKAALLLNASFLKTHLRLAGLSQLFGMHFVVHIEQLGFCAIYHLKTTSSYMFSNANSMCNQEAATLYLQLQTNSNTMF